MLKGVALFLGSVLAAAAYLTIYVSVAGETPKQKLLEHSNALLASRLELVNNRLDIYQERLGVLAEIAPTHIAGLPVAINIQCHCMRCEKCVL